MAEGFARSLIKHSTEEEFDSDVISEDVKIASAGDESDLYDVVFENDSYKICKPKAAEGYQILASGTRWLSGRWSFNSRQDGYDELDDGEDDWLGFHTPAADKYSDKYIILDKNNPKKKWQFIHGLGELMAPSKATYSCATWVVKNGDEDMWRWFISQRFPYISNGIDKKIGGKLIAAKTVFRYPDDMKEITLAARRTSNITSVEFAPGVTAIRADAFADLNKVREIVVPDGVKSIGSRAFGGCSSLERVVLPDSVEKIGNRAFYFCDSLRSIKLPQGLKSIADGAFCYSGITGVPDMPPGIKEIPAMCFCMCPIKTVIIPDGIETIGRMAFYGCDGLDYVYIPKSVSTIEGDPFLARHFSANQKESRVGVIDCAADSKPPHWDDEWAFVGYDRSGGEYVNVTPEINWGVPSPRRSVTEAFSLDKDTTDFDPEVIEYTGNMDDWNAQVDLRNHLGVLSSVRKLIVADGVEEIDWHLNLRAFDNLEEAVLPASLITIGEFTFSRCPRLASVNIPDGLTRINRSTFFGCESLKSIDIPDSVTEIHTYAFDGCKSLKSIYIPKSVEVIQPYAIPPSCSIYCGALTRPSGWNTPDWIHTIYDPFRNVRWGVSREAYERLTGGWMNESFTLEPAPTFDINTIEYDGDMDAWTDGVNARSYHGMESEVRRLIVAPGVTELPQLNLRVFDNLEEVVLPESLTKIGFAAFSVCKSLRSVTIPEGVTSIGEYAFYGCTSLESVTIPDSVEDIGLQAFRGCAALASVAIPPSVKFIGTSAFYECYSLESVTIPDGVNSIYYETFYGCHHLTSVTIPDSVIFIGDRAFYGCDSLVSVYIPASVDMITQYAIPASVAVYCGAARTPRSGWRPSWHNRATRNVFWGISRYEYESMNSLGESFSLERSDNSLDQDVIEYSGDMDEWDAIYNLRIDTGTLSFVRKLIVAQGVTVLPDIRLYNLRNLEEVELPDSLTVIGDCVFFGCESLKSVDIPDSVTSIGRSAFFGCESLKSVDIPSGVTTIRYATFRGCVSLESVNIPDTVTEIGRWAFDGCDSLKSIYIPKLVDSVEEYAIPASCAVYCWTRSEPEGWGSEDGFGLRQTWYEGDDVHWGVDREEYERLKGGWVSESFSLERDSVEFDPEVIEYSGNIHRWEERVELYRQMDAISSVRKLIVADGVKEIDWQLNPRVFRVFNNLEEVVLPDTVTEIGYQAFYGCESLKSVNIPEGVTSIGKEAFQECKSLEDVVIPNGVTSIGNSAFACCSSLNSINIPDSVTKIGNFAFYQCYLLTSVIIPSGVTSIGDYAFDYCCRIKSIAIPDSVTSIGDWAFYLCKSLESVNIPDSVISIGKEAFDGCKSLKSVTIPDSVTSIGDYAFRDCLSLRSVYIPESVRTVGAYAIPPECSVFCGVENPPQSGRNGWRRDWHHREDRNVFWGVSRSDYDSMGSKGVNESFSLEMADDGGADSTLVYDGDEEAWVELKSALRSANLLGGIRRLIVADGVEEVPSYFAKGLGEVTEVVLPDSVRIIGSRAFFGCKDLESIELPDGLEAIGYYAFAGCQLKSVRFPDSLTFIGVGAFSGCKQLSSVTLPDPREDSLYILDAAFQDCDSLGRIYIPESTEVIHGYAIPWSCSVECGHGGRPEQWSPAWHGSEDGDGDVTWGVK